MSRGSFHRWASCGTASVEHREGDSSWCCALPCRGAALVKCSPLTGRTHQIRLHLAHAGHSIVGDDIYGRQGPWIGRQALHAAALEVTHPVTGERLLIRAPLLPDMRRACQMLQLTCPVELVGDSLV